MENSIDFRFVIELLIPQANYGWLNPNSFDDILGKYEYIDWHDSRPKPTEDDLLLAWREYIAENGTFEQQEKEKKDKRDRAIIALKVKANNDKDIADLLEIIL